MGKFARSWALAKASLQVLRSDKELLVFPLVSGAAALVVAASFLLPMFGLGLFERLDAGGGLSPMATFLASQGLPALALAVAVAGVLAVLLLALVQAALSGIHSAVLYRFAVQGDAPAGFDAVLLRDAFQRKA